MTIPVNCKGLIFHDSLQAIDSYILYLNTVGSTNTTNPFLVDDNGYPVIHFRDVLSIKNSNSPVIIIDLITEGFNASQEFDHYPKDKKYIMFSNGWWDQSQFDFGFDYQIFYWNYFLYDYVKRNTYHNLIDFFQNKNYRFTPNKPLVFSSLIGFDRPWRDRLVNKLVQQLNFNNYILNYNGQELGQPSRELDIQYNFLDFDSYRPLCQSYTISSSIPLDIYNASRVLLVVETNMYEHNEFHLTEKTVKALLTGAPFIIVSSAEFLAHLRSLGFMTYDSIWDESYDLIVDPNRRMEAIVTLLNDINQMEWTGEQIGRAHV